MPLAPQDGGPQVVGLGGEDLVAGGRLDDPRLLGELVLELAGTPPGVSGEDTGAADGAVELLRIIRVGADEPEVLVDERTCEFGPIELGQNDDRGLRDRS